MSISEPSLTDKLRLMKSSLESADSSALSPTDLLEIESLLSAYPIEVAELKASPKQLSFQRCFFNRADPSGRKCSIFVALGGNRSGKSYVAGWLCFAKYVREHAKDGDVFWCVGQTNDRSRGGQQKELLAGVAAVDVLGVWRGPVVGREARRLKQFIPVVQL